MRPNPQPPNTRKRTFHYAWCNRTEVDYVCQRCGTIVVEGECLHCTNKAQRQFEKLKALHERTQAEKKAQKEAEEAGLF
jgi:transcription initiation factor IIE alpha subunit